VSRIVVVAGELVGEQSQVGWRHVRGHHVRSVEFRPREAVPVETP
jgi:hypothetical protein